MPDLEKELCPKAIADFNETLNTLKESIKAEAWSMSLRQTMRLARYLGAVDVCTGFKPENLKRIQAATTTLEDIFLGVHERDWRWSGERLNHLEVVISDIIK